MRAIVRVTTAFIVAILISSFLLIHPAVAQAGSAYDLINTVNSLRQSQGLAPYTIENYLMGFAQTQSDYMASLGTWTHIRADGSTAFDYGIKENVAMGTDMSVSYCVYTVWSDAVHWQTMVGYETGTVGAGVTVVDGVVYYTLNVRPGDSTSTTSNTNFNEQPVSYSPQQETTQEYISQVITNTPDADGIIYHTVQYGETLWSIAIAYNTTIDEILTNSGLPLNTTEVFEGTSIVDSRGDGTFSDAIFHADRRSWHTNAHPAPPNNDPLPHAYAKTNQHAHTAPFSGHTHFWRNQVYRHCPDFDQWDWFTPCDLSWVY